MYAKIDVKIIGAEITPDLRNVIGAFCFKKFPIWEWNLCRSKKFTGEEASYTKKYLKCAEELRKTLAIPSSSWVGLYFEKQRTVRVKYKKARNACTSKKCRCFILPGSLGFLRPLGLMLKQGPTSRRAPSISGRENELSVLNISHGSEEIFAKFFSKNESVFARYNSGGCGRGKSFFQFHNHLFAKLY